MQIRREINSHSHYLTKSLLTGEPNKYTDESYDDIALGYIAVRDFPEMRILERLAMYERRFELSLYKTMAEFKKLQKTRKAEQAGAIRLKKQSQSRKNVEYRTRNIGFRRYLWHKLHRLF